MSDETQHTSNITGSSQDDPVLDPLGLDESIKTDKASQDHLGDDLFEDPSVNSSNSSTMVGESPSDRPSEELGANVAAPEPQASEREDVSDAEVGAEEKKAEDELWDEGGDFEEVPLFEEFASKIAEAESKPKNIVDELSSELEAAVAESSQVSEDDNTQEVEDSQPQTLPSMSPVVAWVVSAIAVLSILGGGWFLWKMYSRASIPPMPVSNQKHLQPQAALPSHQVTNAAPPKTSANVAPSVPASSVQVPSEHPKIAETPRLAPLEYISLAPFLIPAQQGGEPVFLKLQVELVCKDKQMKDELSRKETWVRDVIYREMKGVDLSSGLQDNSISRFRRPIMDRINRELAPLYVDDVRLMGTLLK